MTEPPIIDLKPSHPRYPNGAPKSYGKVHTGQMVFTLAVAVGFLGLAYFNRTEYGSDLLFWSATFFGALGGGALVILFRRFI